MRSTNQMKDRRTEASTWVCDRMIPAFGLKLERQAGDDDTEFSNGVWPQRTPALFAAFTADLHGAACQVQFANEQLCGLRGASPGVIEKQQQCLIAASRKP